MPLGNMHWEVLSLFNNLIRRSRGEKVGKWDGKVTVVIELDGKTVGSLAMAIGKAFART